jgi:uncharacterized LabA/DUF88 family protein
LSKNVAVFVDVANIFYAAKAAGVDIDYVTLLKASSAGRDLVRAYAYTGLDPENENQRNFHDFLRRHGYKVVSKDIRKYGDGKVKANLDIELVVDMMKTARNLDIAIVVSGDGDFAPAIRAVQEMGVRVEVVSFRGNTSSDLIDVADIFTDITQIAKVEKGSARSGRRVADDDEDLSMTEVPDKMTEGTGDGRRRGRGGRTRAGEAATPRSTTSRTATSRTATSRTAASRTTASRTRSSSPAAVAGEAVAAEGALVALPGEKLSRAARSAATVEAPEAAADSELEGELAGQPEGDEEGEGPELLDANGQPVEDAPRRRRRRRGGRGRGRGAATRREGEAGGEGDVAVGAEDFGEPEEPEPLPTPRRAAFSFGSVWDSQLGKTPAAASGAAGARAVPDEEDLEEPAIPEYLLAERRQREGARRPGRGGPGARRGGAYAAALDRERFGGGRGSTTSRFAEPGQRHGAAREVISGRDAGPASRPTGRGYERPAPRGAGGEPWSEVPPEIEAMLRAQLAGSERASRPAPTGGRDSQANRPQGSPPDAASAVGEAHDAASAAPSPEAKPARASRARGAATGRRTAGARAAAGTAATEAAPAPAGEAVTKPAARGRRTPQARPASAAVDAPTGEAAEAAGTSRTGAPKRGGRSRSAADSAATTSGESEAAAKPRATRRKTAATD